MVGKPDFLGIQRQENKRKPSATDPHLIDNNQVLIVSTESSYLNSSIVRLVESTGNIPTTIVPTVAMEAEDLLDPIGARPPSSTTSSRRIRRTMLFRWLPNKSKSKV